MRLLALSLTSFRNLVDLSVPLDHRFTVIYGHNGAGKTSVLEAIWLLSTLRSFRANDLRPLLRHGESQARAHLTLDDEQLGLHTTLEVRLHHSGNQLRRTALRDDKVVAKASDFYGSVAAVLFTPEDLGVLRGSPSARRNFIDRICFARDRAHIVDAQEYDKILRSRNKVLKDPTMPSSQREDLLDVYDRQLARCGTRVRARRIAILSQLRTYLDVAFAEIHDLDIAGRGGALACDLSYLVRTAADKSEAWPVLPAGDPVPAQAHLQGSEGRVGEPGRPAHGEDPPDSVDALALALQQSRRRDIQRGTTGVGPHLDDLSVLLGGTSAALHASQGQTRALVLALKLAEMRAANLATGRRPILLLDDVSSELDPERSSRLFACLAQDSGQCLLTTTAREFVRLPRDLDRRDLELAEGVLRPSSGQASGDKQAP